MVKRIASGRETELHDALGRLLREHGATPRQAIMLLERDAMHDRPSSAAGVASVDSSPNVPVTIFQADDLGPLEAIVKYLREERGLRLCDIARLTGRDQRAIGVAYMRAKAKMPRPNIPMPCGYMFPIGKLREPGLTVLEHIVMHLRKRYGLRLMQIAGLLDRDDRTIWTIQHRAAENKNNE